ncbi:MAG: 30S ribosomal protein S8 [Candidatus Cloacimonadota bacterium]|nr:30S ribosomal protein S8 [Candidatus Cloacimonadota bacterium]
MSVTDPIADALTKIRNAFQADHSHVSVNHSKVVEAIVRILNEERFINQYELEERNVDKGIYRKQININLRYTNSGVPVVRGIERISKPGLRIYINADNIPSVYNHTGSAIISTSSGVMTDRGARKKHIGGEYLCKVW